MTTSIQRSVRHSLLVEEQELGALFQFIAKTYEKTTVEAACSDGSTLEAADIADVKAFENPSFRRIETLTIEGRDSWEETASVRMRTPEWSFYDGTAQLTVRSESDEKAVYVAREVANRLREMKPSYDLVARVSVIAVLLCLLVAGLLGLGLAEVVGLIPYSEPEKQRSELARWTVVAVGCAALFGAGYALDLGRKRLFPRLFFALGRQKKVLARIEKWRAGMLVGLAVSIVGGLAAGLMLRYV